jgi:hypothetical protein
MDTTLEARDTAADDYSGHLPNPQHSDYQGGNGGPIDPTSQPLAAATEISSMIVGTPESSSGRRR